MAKWNLKNKVVVITGGAGGLGQALATAFVIKGSKVALFDLDKDALDAQVEALGAHHAAAWKVDVRSMEQLDRATKEAAEKFGRIDAVIAGAGIELFYPTLELSEGAFERIIDINLVGIFRTFKAAYPYIQQSKGYLLTVSSMAAFVHPAYGSGYTASKAGNFAFTNSLRQEMRQFGVGVGSVHPTWFKTPMVTGVMQRPAWKHLTNDNKSKLAEQVSLAAVVSGIVSGVENRSDTVVIPWKLRYVGFMAPILRPILEWLGPDDEGLRNAYVAFRAEPKL